MCLSTAGSRGARCLPNPLSLEMRVQIGPGENIDPPDASVSVPVATPVTCREGSGEILL